MRIVIVDDNKSFRDGIQFILSGINGYKIVGEAEDGFQAVKMIEEKKPDLVLMDIEMPIINGIDVTRKIVNNSPEIKFLAVTMYQEKVYMNELFDAGFRGCVYKNDVVKELIPAIEVVSSEKLCFPYPVTQEVEVKV